MNPIRAIRCRARSPPSRRTCPSSAATLHLRLWRRLGAVLRETPYEDFGRLTYERAGAREQALAYLRDHTALSEHEVTTEVDRYISWPGQALSYKLGEIAIVRLRAQAEKELGDKFDIKGFHDTLLKQGSVPLPVLEQQIQAYIAERKKA